MKSRSFILRCAAFLLMLVFSQKAGTSLLLHNLFHTSQSAENPDKKNGSTEVSYACSCIDDFLIPFLGEEVISLPPVETVYPSTPDHAAVSIPQRTAYFTSLRGPPSCIL
jgi:hypothetical protein